MDSCDEDSIAYDLCDYNTYLTEVMQDEEWARFCADLAFKLDKAGLLGILIDRVRNGEEVYGMRISELFGGRLKIVSDKAFSALKQIVHETYTTVNFLKVCLGDA